MGTIEIKIVLPTFLKNPFETAMSGFPFDFQSRRAKPAQGRRFLKILKFFGKLPDFREIF